MCLSVWWQGQGECVDGGMQLSQDEFMTLCGFTHLKWCVCQFDDKVKESLLTEAQTLLDAINNPSMKEVKGLEDRLYGLEQLMFGAKKIVQEQGEMAQVGGLLGRG